MSFEALQDRLAQLQETQAQLQTLIEKLEHVDFGSSNPEDDGGDDGAEGAEEDLIAELVAEAHQIIKEVTEESELLSEEVIDLPRTAEHEKSRLKDALARLEGEMKTSRVAFRKAQLQARRALEAHHRRERAVLLASYALAAPVTSSSSTASGAGTPMPPSSPSQSTTLAPRPPPRRRHHHRPHQEQQQQPQSATVSKSRDVTRALRETHALIVSEVSRSEFAHQTLAASTAALGDLGERYADLGGMLKNSRALVVGLLRANKSDTWYLQTALYMLIGTAAWLLYRRLLYGPLMLLVWWPLRILFGTGVKVGSAVGGLGAGMAGGGPSMIVGDGSGRTVVGMSEGGSAVPTISVAGGTTSQTESGAEPDSMVEQVGQIVDGQQAQQQQGESTSSEEQQEEQSQKDQPNPKKRMWEEEKEAAKHAERAKDEL